MHLQGAVRYFKFLRKTELCEENILCDAQEPLARDVHSFSVRSCCIPLMMYLRSWVSGGKVGHWVEPVWSGK